MRKYLLLALITIFTGNLLQGQNISQSSPGKIVSDKKTGPGKTSGHLFPQTYRPWLEWSLLAEGKDFINQVFPGAITTMSARIENHGNIVAQSCWVKAHADTPYIIVHYSSQEVFNLAPGEVKIIELQIQVLPAAPYGIVQLFFEIEELNGYDLYPQRSVNLFINEPPDTKLILSDVAIKDQAGEGYIQKYEETDLYFRFQNCSEKIIHDVTVSVNLHEGTLEQSVNRRLRIGDMPPGKVRDMIMTVSTGMSANNIGVNLNIEANEINFTEEVIFDFLTDYKPPEELLEEGCEHYIPRSQNNHAITNAATLNQVSAVPENPNKFSIVIANINYDNLDNIVFASNDAIAFRQALSSQLGFKDNNNYIITNMRKNIFETFSSPSRNSQTNFHNTFRTRMAGKELVIYYVGYAAADLQNGEIFLIPTDYNPNNARPRISANDFYHSLAVIKDRYNFRSVAVYLNLFYTNLTAVGNKNFHDIRLHDLHETLDGFTTIFTIGTKNQTPDLSASDISPFTLSLISGLTGRADFSNDGQVSASELHRYVSDEFLGVPSKARRQGYGIQIPLLIGKNKILLEYD